MISFRNDLRLILAVGTAHMFSASVNNHSCFDWRDRGVHCAEQCCAIRKNIDWHTFQHYLPTL